MNLRSKTVLITGSALRIGRAMALAFAKKGATLVLHYHHSLKEAQGLQREVNAFGSEAYLVQADFSKNPTLPVIQKLIREVHKHVKHIDCLINNASAFYATPFGKVKEHDWDQLMTVNLKAPFFLSQEIGKTMLQAKSGKIINLLDWAVSRPPSNYLPYIASKAGLEVLTRGLARALAPHVQVNGIACGPILPARGMSVKQKKAVTGKTLLKRFGDPEDVVAAAKYLIEESDFVTGSVLPVEGGSLVA